MAKQDTSVGRAWYAIHTYAGYENAVARNLRQLYAIVDRIHAAGASFRSLTEGIDYSTPMGQLMFAQLGAFAQFEAAMTAKRTAAGIAALKERGYAYGAAPKLTPKEARRLVQDFKAGGVSKAELARKYDISPVSVTNYLERAKRRKPK
jgi:DNA invertase Pin-like site-specific DNA recombinase